MVTYKEMNQGLDSTKPHEDVSQKPDSINTPEDRLDSKEETPKEKPDSIETDEDVSPKLGHLKMFPNLTSEPDSRRVTWYTGWINAKDLLQKTWPEEISILHLRKNEGSKMKTALQTAAENHPEFDFYSVLYSVNIRDNWFIVSMNGRDVMWFHIDDKADDLDKELEKKISAARWNTGLNGFRVYR